MEKVQLSRTKRLLAGHPWVFSNELAHSVKGIEPGSLVELLDRRDRFLAIAYLNPHSLIAARVLSRERTVIDRAFIDRRLRSAVAHRQRFAKGRDAYRLVYSEGDGLPGLIVDRFGDCLALQVTTAGMERLTPAVVDALVDIVQPRTIVLRNDTQARQLEGLPKFKDVIRGALEPLPVIREGRVRIEVDPLNGQKTGFFLDQRDNRLLLASLVAGGRGIDLFCYTGAWGLQAAAAGAEVIAVDTSEQAIARARVNCDRNGLTSRLRFVQEDAFTFLAQQREAGAVFDFAVVDPPAFVKSKQKVKEALRAYGSLNTQVLSLIRAGGIVATSSCSYHIARDSFLDLLGRAAGNSGRSLRLLGLSGQGADHPIPLAMPEAAYLKCAFLQVGEEQTI